MVERGVYSSVVVSISARVSSVLATSTAIEAASVFIDSRVLIKASFSRISPSALASASSRLSSLYLSFSLNSPCSFSRSCRLVFRRVPQFEVAIGCGKLRDGCFVCGLSRQGFFENEPLIFSNDVNDSLATVF